MKKGANLYSIPKEAGKGKATVYALLVHIVLFVFLWIGIRWQNEAAGAVEAEVWDVKVSEAAPKAMESTPLPVEKTEQAERVAPEEKTIPKASELNPDIALEQEKKRKQEKKLADEKEKAEEKRKQQEKIVREEETKKQKAADAKKKQESAADQKARNALLAEEARRIAASGSGGSGKSAYSTGNNRADTSYMQKVGARIKSNTIFNVPENLSTNPAVEYEVELMPNGDVRNVRKRKSSGIVGFDEAVRRAIEKSSPYPPDKKNGRVPSGFILSHKPKG